MAVSYTHLDVYKRQLKGHLEMAEQLGLASRMLTRGQLKMNMQVLGSEQVPHQRRK